LSSRGWRLLFWIVCLYALVMALVPHSPRLPGDPNDKVQHIIAFAVLASLGRVAYRGAPAMVLLAGLSLFGAAIEILQTIPGLNRDGDPFDWLADTASTAVVLAAFRLLRRA
jgi:hypothetical protein